jgi:two-component system, chemotaxis family, protein-glutamate methylesterase/glutaminase
MSKDRVLKVLVCEDSKTYAAALKRVIEHDRGLEVVGVCLNAEQTLSRLKQIKPDLVTMDLELPEMSGVETIAQIMSVSPLPILVLSGHADRHSQEALAALAAGALEALSKQELDLADPDGPSSQMLRQRIQLLSGVRVIRHPLARLAQSQRSRDTPAATGRRIRAIGICASTGGPPALATVLGQLPSSFPIPILVVQHMAAGFLVSFAEWLDGQVPLPVRIAVDKAELAPGIWVAPEGAHLTVGYGGFLALDRRTAAGLHRPSADVLLRSLATACGAEAAVVVLTGMGADGAEGIGEVRRHDGLTIAQDEATSAVFGMPRAAAENGAGLVLPLDSISAHLMVLQPATLISLDAR